METSCRGALESPLSVFVESMPNGLKILDLLRVALAKLLVMLQMGTQKRNDCGGSQPKPIARGKWIGVSAKHKAEFYGAAPGQFRVAFAVLAACLWTSLIQCRTADCEAQFSHAS